MSSTVNYQDLEEHSTYSSELCEKHLNTGRRPPYDQFGDAIAFQDTSELELLELTDYHVSVTIALSSLPVGCMFGDFDTVAGLGLMWAGELDPISQASIIQPDLLDIRIASGTEHNVSGTFSQYLRICELRVCYFSALFRSYLCLLS